MALRNGAFPIVVGGDHSQALGSIAGMKKVYPNAKILWIDAHIDGNTPETSPSGNIHGMPVAMLAGKCDDFQQCIDLKTDIIYLGIRSF